MELGVGNGKGKRERKRRGDVVLALHPFPFPHLYNGVEIFMLLLAYLLLTSFAPLFSHVITGINVPLLPQFLPSQLLV